MIFEKYNIQDKVFIIERVETEEQIEFTAYFKNKKICGSYVICKEIKEDGKKQNCIDYEKILIKTLKNDIKKNLIEITKQLAVS